VEAAELETRDVRFVTLILANAGNKSNVVWLNGLSVGRILKKELSNEITSCLSMLNLGRRE